MITSSRSRRSFVAACLALSTPQALAGEIVPLAGCYARTYDAAWLKSHPGQTVRRATLSVTKTTVPETPGEAQPILADALLVLWVGDTAFSTIGACYWDKIGLVCNASLSAAQARPCKTKEEGVRSCRLSTTDPGSFELAQKSAGLTLTVRERLELAGPLDDPLFLYLGVENGENRSFLLQPAPESVCK